MAFIIFLFIESYSTLIQCKESLLVFESRKYTFSGIVCAAVIKARNLTDAMR